MTSALPLTQWDTYTAYTLCFVCLLPPCFTAIEQPLCVCVMRTRLMICVVAFGAWFCSDSGINHWLRDKCVFPAAVAGLCLRNSVLYPVSNQGVPVHCKSTYTIPGLAPEVSLGAPFPSAHLPLFLLTSAPFPQNQSRIVRPRNPSSLSSSLSPTLRRILSA